VSAARRILTVRLAGPAGRLEGLLEDALTPVPAFAALVCHPHPLYGGTMHNKVAHKTAATLQELGGAVLRFNFRGVGRSEGRFAGGEGERDDARAALAHLRRRYPGARLWVAGFSFGAWVGLRVGAEEDDVERLIGIAPPVSTFDFSFLERCAKPKLLVQGDRDETCPLPALQGVLPGWAEPKTLLVIQGANHFFDKQLTRLSRALHEALPAGSPS
jgi:alpha/beta superfamily hydrolase